MEITMLKNKKVVLGTGGAGFIGSNVCSALLNRNCHVICMDNLFCSTLKNIQCFSHNPDFEFIEHDITQPFSFYVDEIYNFACPASPKYYQKDPIYTMKTNVIGVLNILELATQHHAKILQASTSEVYGDALQHPQQEDYWGNVNPVGIRSCYDEGKRAAESLCVDYYRQYKTKVKIARIFNCYGPGMQMDDGRAICNFIVQALQHKDITIYGTGAQTRSFCYIDDLVRGLLALMETPVKITGPINLGTSEEITINELAMHILKLCETNVTCKYMALPTDDPKQRQPDISLAKKVLQWQPVIKLDKGLEKTIAYFKDLLAI
ncbi:UDP-glucuronic acid decarboxylase family protein [uncultured Treponema sp.]|uniref:UDP-glucuronic acid decarboxylase family protein n=1 Tax=uncultured Treponema sp. TaxID=162155 RepID=UPI0028F02BB9|nr:UDP-glucuronic acid decarboxylase family protein [uncultured Treponema sp.]